LLACAQVSQEKTYLAETDSRSNRATTRNEKSIVAIGEILEDQSKVVDGKKVVGKSITRIRTMAAALEESQIVGREKEKEEIVKLVTSQVTNRFQVVSVWGMGGLGKTTLVKDIYHIKLSGMFEKRACVTVMRPFSLVELLRSLVMQLEPSEKKDVEGLMRNTKKIFLLMPVAELIEELARILERKRCLVVLDDVSSTVEWDMIIPFFHEMKNSSRIVVTTRGEHIAKHCSEQKENIYKLKGLEYKDAFNLFAKKVLSKKLSS
jgi:hypothetical protein